MFYTMTRGLDWPRARWRGPIFVGNNLIEDQSWDMNFIEAFASKYNAGNTSIPEIGGWGVHLYGNFECGPSAGTTDDPCNASEVIPEEIPFIVDRSMALLDKYLADRADEGNSTSIMVTEFGFLEASWFYDPPRLLYDTTVRFMEEYVPRFDKVPQIQRWFWYVSHDGQQSPFDTDNLYSTDGSLTPNGLKWRDLAQPRQNGV